MSTEPLELRIRAETSPQALSASVVKALQDKRVVLLVAVGPFPVNIGVKAVALASRHFATHGIVLGIIPGMEQREFKERDGGTVQWVVTTLRVFNAMKGLD